MRRRPLHTCSRDITEAYDSVKRERAWKALLHWSAPPKAMHFLMDIHMCMNVYTFIPNGCESTRSWPWRYVYVETGFRQGDVVSLMLFKAYMDVFYAHR